MRCIADRDSGRGTVQRSFDPKDAPFRRALCPTCRTAGKLRLDACDLCLHYKVKEGHGGLFSKAAQDELFWNVNEGLSVSLGQPLEGLFVVAQVFDICSRPFVCANGGVRLFRQKFECDF